MFRFFSSGPPLTTQQRVEIELLMRRNIEALGWDAVKSADPPISIAQLNLDHSSPECFIDHAVALIRARIPINDRPIDVSVAPRSALDASSTYQPATDSSAASIRIVDELLADPLRAFMELAYQLGAHFWHGIPGPSEQQMEPRLTHLVPICCGLGVLASDASVYDANWHSVGYSGWEMSRIGYYNTVQLGYALALLTRYRREGRPAWTQALRLDSRATLNRAQRYFAMLDKQRVPLLFDADRIPSTNCSQTELARWLSGEDDSFAFAAASAVIKGDLDVTSLMVESALNAIGRNDPDVVPLAIRIVGSARSPEASVTEKIKALVGSRSHRASIAAIDALSRLGIPMDQFRARITRLLAQFPDDSMLLIDVVARQGRAYEAAGPVVCRHFAEAIEHENEDAIVALVNCLQQISADPKTLIERHIHQVHLKQKAMELLR